MGNLFGTHHIRRRYTQYNRNINNEKQFTMKKILFLFIIFSFFLNENVNSQHKPRKLKKQYTRFAKSDNCIIDAKVSTGLTYLSGSFKTVGISYVKTGDSYYLFLLQQRQFGKKFEIQKENPLEIYFENNELMKLFPCGDFEGRAKFAIGSFYLMTEEQIRYLSNNNIIYIHVYITNDKGYSKANKDEDGKLFLKYSINVETDRDTWSWPAKFVLSY